MVKELTDREWTEVTSSLGRESSKFDPSFLNAIAEAYQCEVKYFVCFHKNRPVTGAALYVKRGSIVLPSYYVYSSIWLAETEKSLLYRQSMRILLQHLTGQYQSIQLRLPPDMRDARPFLWENFKGGFRYTYMKDLSQLDHSAKIRSRIRRAGEEGIEISVTRNFNQVWEQQKDDLQRFNFSVRKIFCIRKMLLKLFDSDFLLLINAHKDGNMIASACILLDPKLRHASNLLISSNKINYQTGVHAALYDGIFRHLARLGYHTNDLVGANMQNIADFKANFKPELVPYFELEYSYLDHRFNMIRSKVREKVSAILSRWR